MTWGETWTAAFAWATGPWAAAVGVAHDGYPPAHGPGQAEGR